MEKTPEQLYQERERRVMDAIHLKIPDRVPIVTSVGYFPATYTGIPFETAWYDYERWLEAYKKTLTDFQPDMAYIQPFFPGKVLEYLDPRQTLWPGHGVSPYHSHQAVELDSMKADEYDAYLGDTSDFTLRVLFPRICGAMEPFRKFPPLSSLGHSYWGTQAIAETLARPEVAEAIKTLQKAGREMEWWQSKVDRFNEEIKKMGFPPFSGGRASAPFDTISDFLRGMHGAMLDMYRQPDKLLALCERLLKNTLERALPAAKRSGNPRVFMALHRGSDGFMSLKQFETFYWPQLKRIIIAFVNEGLTPCIFFEGDWTARLEYLLELPGAAILAHFDSTDIFRAKDVLKDHMCIRGNVPSSLLGTGTPGEVRDYCKKLIDIVGKGGGYIMGPRSSADEARPENFKAMIDFTREYGVYN
jgi:uroporphyrinogen-III decarboxylase